MGNRILIFCLAWMLFASSCAIQVAPTGGEKDTIPPVAKNFTPENYSTDFHGHDIAIDFSEYIVLKELSAQLIVSPPLKNAPDINVKKKSLEIHLDDTLLENTTYTMNFGNAITDLREGNPLEDFQYVFSTGNVIDSLRISGTVTTAFNDKTEKGLYVMLYHDSDDSLPLKSLPNYFAKTADDGTFEIRNVAPGAYKVFVLKDLNSNYLFDNNDETIAFANETAEAGSSKLTLRLFKEMRKQQLLKVTSEEPGHIIVAYALPLKNERIVFLSDTAALKIYSVAYSEKHDSLNIWYRNLQADSLNFILSRDTVVDTIAPRLKKYDQKFKSKTDFSLKTQFENNSDFRQDLNRPFELFFNHPVDSFDLSKISVTEDSVPVTKYTAEFSDSLKQVLKIDLPKKEKAKYHLIIPKNTFKDIFGLVNDSLELNLTMKSVTDYGTMAVKINSAGNGHYILQLIDEKETVYRQSFFTGDTTINYDYLEPRSYRLKLIEDENNNHEWDTGNYLRHVQPEKVFYYKESLTVRANWDVEIKWPIGN